MPGMPGASQDVSEKKGIKIGHTAAHRGFIGRP
jgi:hypothetical protein